MVGINQQLWVRLYIYILYSGKLLYYIQQLWDYISIQYLYTIIGLHMYMHIATD